MGFLDRILGSAKVAFNPEDLVLPDEMDTDIPGKRLKKSSYTQKVEINIVGESFRAKSIATIAQASSGSEFDIYLIPEPTNQYDKKAVAVYAANLHVGYIAKPENKEWFKWVMEALETDICLWGRAKTFQKSGTSNVGVFGHIFMPASAKSLEDIPAVKMTPVEFAKTLEKVKKLSNSIEEPESLAKMRSAAKSTSALAVPILAHAKFLLENEELSDIESSAWESIFSTCDDIISTAAESRYCTDPDDLDVTSGIYDLAAELDELIK
jgi:hypothetical protein